MGREFDSRRFHRMYLFFSSMRAGYIMNGDGNGVHLDRVVRGEARAPEIIDCDEVGANHTNSDTLSISMGNAPYDCCDQSRGLHAMHDSPWLPPHTAADEMARCTAGYGPQAAIVSLRTRTESTPACGYKVIFSTLN